MTAPIAPMNTNIQMYLFPELRASSLFAGRHWANCRNGMMGAGICLAAVGAVLSFKLQSVITAVAFIALGIILLLSSLLMNNSDQVMRRWVTIQSIKIQADPGDRQYAELVERTQNIKEEEVRIKNASEAMAISAEQMELSYREFIEKMIQLEELKSEAFEISNRLIAQKDELLVVDIRLHEIVPHLNKLNASLLHIDGKIARRKHTVKKLDRTIQQKQQELERIKAEIAVIQRAL